jgi:hypothetical protein
MGSRNKGQPSISPRTHALLYRSEAWRVSNNDASSLNIQNGLSHSRALGIVSHLALAEQRSASSAPGVQSPFNLRMAIRCSRQSGAPALPLLIRERRPSWTPGAVHHACGATRLQAVSGGLHPVRQQEPRSRNRKWKHRRPSGLVRGHCKRTAPSASFGLRP